jgi:hypothetical protein
MRHRAWHGRQRSFRLGLEREFVEWQFVQWNLPEWKFDEWKIDEFESRQLRNIGRKSTYRRDRGQSLPIGVVAQRRTRWSSIAVSKISNIAFSQRARQWARCVAWASVSWASVGCHSPDGPIFDLGSKNCFKE